MMPHRAKQHDIIRGVFGQARASKLSFNDIIKRLTGGDETSATFISKRVCIAHTHAALGCAFCWTLAQMQFV